MEAYTNKSLYIMNSSWWNIATDISVLNSNFLMFNYLVQLTEPTTSWVTYEHWINFQLNSRFLSNFCRNISSNKYLDCNPVFISYFSRTHPKISPKMTKWKLQKRYVVKVTCFKTKKYIQAINFHIYPYILYWCLILRVRKTLNPFSINFPFYLNT